MKYGLVSESLPAETDSRLEVAAVRGRTLFHVGVHSEEYGVVVGVLEADDVHVRAERDLVHKVQLQRTYAPFLDFLLRKTVHDPVDIAAVVYMVVYIEVAVAGSFRIN